MHTQIIDGRKFIVADSLKEAFVNWYGEQAGNALFDATRQFKKKPEKCVYVLKMKNGTIKIGITANFDRRLCNVITSSGSGVDKWAHTDYLNSSRAYQIENVCHKKFKEYRQQGEFFKVAFTEACEELEKHSPIVDKYIQ